MLKNILKNGGTHDKVQFDTSIFEVNKEKQMVNLTKMCKAFNKRIDVWAKRKATKDFIQANKAFAPNGGIEIIQGGNGEQGTFGTREVALEVAQWISPKFKVFCIQKLDELFQTGQTKIASGNFVENALALADTVKNMALEIKRKEKIISSQNDTNKDLLDLKATQTKTGIKTIKNDIGKEINIYVNRLFFEDAGSHRQAHINSRELYKRETGDTYPGAKLASLETKKDYLNWLRKKC